jgi:hypothetical protein
MGSPLVQALSGKCIGAFESVKFFLMPGAERFDVLLEALGQGLVEARCVERFAANPAMHQVEGYNRVPGTFQQMLEFDGILRTNAPTLAAARTQGHVVLQCALIAPVLVAQGGSRAILHTGQTSVALIIYTKI